MQELQNRGFYVAPQASSNYVWSFQSIPSSLNMRYVDELAAKDDRNQLRQMADDHALGRILKSLGYEYLHIASGYPVTNTSRNTGSVVEFTPSGSLVSEPAATDQFSLARAIRISRRFTTVVLQTTAVRPFVAHGLAAQVSDDAPAHGSIHSGPLHG